MVQFSRGVGLNEMERKQRSFEKTE